MQLNARNQVSGNRNVNQELIFDQNESNGQEI